MSRFAEILPGARIMLQDGVLGTLERLAGPEDEPDRMIVRSDEGEARYAIPLIYVESVTQDAFHPTVRLQLLRDQLGYYPADAPYPVLGEDEQGPSDESEAVLRLSLAAESLTVEKRPITLGHLHVHTGIETYEEVRNIPIAHEEAVVEHISLDQYEETKATYPNDILIPIVEEQLVVEKRQVVREYIRVRKSIVNEEQVIRDTLRREFVTIEADSEKVRINEERSSQ